MKLSKEVSDYLQSADEDSQGNVASNVSKISFIGFSLGGLICRQSFPYLAKYKEKMHAFITLSSPHIGYASHESSLVKSSLWIMEKFVEAGSVKQLNMNDAKNPYDCFLYKLSKQPGLEWFKHIYLFSSV